MITKLRSKGFIDDEVAVAAIVLLTHSEGRTDADHCIAGTCMQIRISRAGSAHANEEHPGTARRAGMTCSYERAEATYREERKRERLKMAEVLSQQLARC